MKKTRKYECMIQFGSRCKGDMPMWVSGARFVGNSIAITFSNEPVAIPYDLAVHASELVLLAENPPSKHFSVCYSTVDEVVCDAAPSEEVPGNE